MRDKSNSVRLFRDMIKDRNQVIKEITYYNHGSLNNPFKVRSILIKNKKGTYELSCYNKTEEIKQSGKEYINDYHKLHNPKFKKLYRIEIRLTSDEIRRYIKKHKKPISFNDVINPEFLHTVFSEYLDRIIVIYKNGQSKRKREKISLIPPVQIVPPVGILQPTLSDNIFDTQQSDNKINANINFNKIKDSIINEYLNEIKIEKYRHQIFINKISNNINNYKIYNSI